MEWILQPEPCEPGPPAPIIEDLLTSAEFVNSDMPMVWLRRALILSEEVITNTALATKGQRNNPMWSIIRKNRITASNFGAVPVQREDKLPFLSRNVSCPHTT